jgi:mannose-6-phosphate isomerase-like protein (cupin superfamily)
MRFFFVIVVLSGFSDSGAQTAFNTDTIGSESKTENIYSRPLFGDSLSSSFCILIKKEVKAHKHLLHSEHVTVLEGEGLMKLEDRAFTIKKGDVIFIPKKSVHSVKTTGRTPLKVLSVQSPFFDGSDRIMVEEK